MDLGALNLPKSEIERFAFVQNFQTRLYLQYAGLLKTDLGRRVMEELRKDPRVQGLEGKMLSRGSGAHLFQDETLGMWFLWRANETDFEAAAHDLEKFLDADTITVLNTLWVLGVEVEAPVVLAGGYVLRPVESMPDSWDKESFLQTRLDHHLQFAPVPTCAITKDCEVQKVGSESLPGPDDEDSEFWAASRRLQDIAVVLNAVGGVSCLPFFSTSYVYPQTPVGPFGGSGGGSVVYDVLCFGSTRLSPESAETVNTLVAKYESLDGPERARMQRVLDRLSQSKRRSQIEDKILDLGIALEMLLLDDNTNNEQLSLTFRLRGSWLLGRSVDDRIAIFEQLKCIYRYRSQVAHSGVLCRGRAADIERVRESFPEYQGIAEAVCQKAILEGKPDWNGLVLGAI